MVFILYLCLLDHFKLLPSTAYNTHLRTISIRVASVCKSSDLPFSLDLVNYWIVSRQYRNSNAATRPAAVNAPVAEQTMVQNVCTLSGNFSVTFWVSARLESEADNLPYWRNQARMISQGKPRHVIKHLPSRWTLRIRLRAVTIDEDLRTQTRVQAANIANKPSRKTAQWACFSAISDCLD